MKRSILTDLPPKAPVFATLQPATADVSIVHHSVGLSLGGPAGLHARIVLGNNCLRPTACSLPTAAVENPPADGGPGEGAAGQ